MEFSLAGFQITPELVSCRAVFIQMVCEIEFFRLNIPDHSVRTICLLAAGPFRATQLWNDIIDHMKDHIEVKRRRVKLRNYESCFTGTEAVDVVLERLQSERLNFTRDVSRDKAVKV